MKQILAITLFFTVIIAIGQEAKLSSAYLTIAASGDTLRSYNYVYDDDDNLLYIDVGGEPGWLITRQYFRNDTIVKFGLPNSDQYIWYHFFNDSIVVPYSFDTTFVITYYPDDTDLIIRKTNPAHVYLYEWENGNMVEETQNGESIKTVSYNLSYINPFYEENKYFRFSVNGSYNYVKELINAENGSSSSYEVSASTGPFPTKVEQYYSGSLAYYHYFNYLYVISDTPEIPPEPLRILSVDYYDIMGRKIPKPTRGFYIRRETTDNGIISTKHYIQ